jgi:hypothetical protein
MFQQGMLLFFAFVGSGSVFRGGRFTILFIDWDDIRSVI